MDLARRMGVSDGTLGRIKYGTGNPTVDVVERIARYFRMEPWELLCPPGGSAVADPRAGYAATDDWRHAAIDALTRDQRAAILAVAHAYRCG